MYFCPQIFLNMKTQIILLLLLLPTFLHAQKNDIELNKASHQINQFGDLYFTFKIHDKSELKTLPKFISIDSRIGNLVKAYIPKPKFHDLLNLHIPFEVIEKSKNKSLTMATNISQMQNWDRYPTYDVYVEMMQQFANDYPELTQLDTIGFSQQNRLVLALKITDNPQIKENEPKFFYSGQMHGDELVGQIMMLRLIDYLLSHYNSNTQIQNLINNIEIWINPLSNPDGLYAGGNNSVSGSTRYFANYVDPNRNFPSSTENHPDGESYAQETIDMMEFANEHHFDLSANLHSGAEVVNYPWDEWDSYTKPHPDNDWWMFVASEYASIAQNNSPSYYFTGIADSGITEGGDWYVIYGGRQDYMNYHMHCREMTLELSNDKMLDSNLLPDHWNYNYQSLIAYITQSLFGVRGVITDQQTGQPIEAKIEIANHDSDNSFVYSHLPAGNYHRYLSPGTYNVTYSKDGYYTQTVTVNIMSYHTLVQDIQLVPMGTDSNPLLDKQLFNIYPNPANPNESLFIKLNENKPISEIEVNIYNVLGSQVKHFHKESVNHNLVKINIDELTKGMYFIHINYNHKLFNHKLIIN